MPPQLYQRRALMYVSEVEKSGDAKRLALSAQPAKVQTPLIIKQI